MLKFDKLKIVSDLKNIKIYDENRFDKIIKNNIVTELIFNIIQPYSLCIKLDYIANELVIEFSGKILKDDYPKLISTDTINTCFENINEMGFCWIDFEGIGNANVVKCDITKDIICSDILSITTYIRNNLSNYQKYNCRLLRNGNFVIEKNVTTRQAKKRLTIYDKGKEMSKVENLRYMAECGIDKNCFDGVCRFELNLNCITQIKSSLEIADTRLRTVLNATTNPIQVFMDDVLNDEQPLQVSNAKSYFVGLVLQDCNFDIAQVENRIRQLYPSKGTNISKVMKPYRTMLSQIQQSSNSRKAELLHLLA
ncbi:hypothetical protein [uncultured Alistipes sp.]|uniref:hypothetical protein n=1 Tax=uncultured Alistipes sp. TaxID=538949 RepID=UPI00261A728D|nr:hypothetical protein [uncultured Alistipes sp.]